jgi:hypothetical protein
MTQSSSPHVGPKLLHNADAVIDRADGNSDDLGEDEAAGRLPSALRIKPASSSAATKRRGRV